MKRFIIAALSCLALIVGWAQDQITNIPTIYINTENGVGVYDKENYVPCHVSVLSPESADVITDKAAGIRGRGNSTWSMAKKPYRVKFDKKINLFNRPAKAKSWVLLANYADKTLMRNAVAFEISRFVGFDFSPTAIFVDLVVNGTYLGNYLVSDQMEVNKGRVDIDEMDATCIEGEGLTGGYFLEIDGFGGSEPVHFTTSKGLIITVKSPDDDVIQSVQLDYIKRYINDFESALFAYNFDDPEKGFRHLVDERSLIDWYICCELTGNSDSFWSTYVYKKRSDNHLYFGPLWDFDIAFNNDNRLGDAVNKLMRDNAHDPKTWINRMWQARWFQEAVYSRWCELRHDGIEEYIIDYIDSTAEYIDQSQRRNFNKWPVLNTRVYREQFLFPTYQAGVDYLKKYIHDRIAFLDLSFRASGAVSEIEGIADGKEYYIMHYVSLYATAESDNFYIKNPQTDYQRLTFVSTSTPGVWNIRTADGRLIASKDGDKYCTYLRNGADTHAQFVIEPSRYPGFACIKNVKTGKYLGIEHTAHNSRISTNKDGTSTLHAWKVLPVDLTDALPDIHNDEPSLVYDPVAKAIVSDRDVNLELYNLSGQCIIRASGTVFSTAALPKGLYIARTLDTQLKVLVK